MSAMHPIMDDEFDEAGAFPDEPPTLCVECDHPHPATAEKAPYYWRCLRFPAEPFGGFVSPDWRPDPPYHRCQDRNDGNCPHWTPKRTPPKGD